MKILILLVAFVAAANAVSLYELVKEEWNAFKVSVLLLMKLIYLST